MMTYPSFSNMSYYNKYSRYGYPYPSFRGHSQNAFYHNSNKTFKQNTFINNKQYSSNSSTSTIVDFNKNKPDNTFRHISEQNTDTKKTENSLNFDDCNSPIFQIFGISLYFDDILLIILIFFLYQEGVKDEWLFIALVLLLLS